MEMLGEGMNHVPGRRSELQEISPGYLKIHELLLEFFL